MQPNEKPGLEVKVLTDEPEHVTLIARAPGREIWHTLEPEAAEALANSLWSTAGQVRGQVLDLGTRLENALPRVETMSCDIEENAWSLHKADRAALAVVAAEAREAARLRQQVTCLQQQLRQMQQGQISDEREVQRLRGERQVAWTALGWLRSDIPRPSTTLTPPPTLAAQLGHLCNALYSTACALDSLRKERDEFDLRLSAILTVPSAAMDDARAAGHKAGLMEARQVALSHGGKAFIDREYDDGWNECFASIAEAIGARANTAQAELNASRSGDESAALDEARSLLNEARAQALPSSPPTS